MSFPNIFVTYTIQDAKGKVSTPRYNLGSAANLGMARRIAEAAVPILVNVIKGAITDIGIGISVAIPGGTPTTPDPDSDVEEGARFSFVTDAGSSTNIRIPTFDEAKLVSGTAQVDTTDTDVQAFVDLMIDGHTYLLENIQPTDERGEDIVALTAAREAFQKSRN